MTTKPEAPVSSSSSFLNDAASDAVPIFLKKTYHMVDTCDPTIASWSEDGETFVVKDPIKFEKEIIPQFFKHSKFSSFVRQLNFYAFRKIKFCDTIRIDPKLEAETANFWRFKHEKFLRGKPELLTEIKRIVGPKQQPKPVTVSSSAVMNAAGKSGAVADKENTALKSEVSTLKQRIEDMSKNIDELTSMVKKVTVSPTPVKQEPLIIFKEKEKVNLHNKRKKLDEPSPELLPLPDKPASSPGSAAMDVDVPAPPSFPSPMRDSLAREESDLTDEGFVDELFSTFKTDDFEFDDISSAIPSQPKDNRPHPELMGRLSEALAMLPREIQEMIVDRLIQAITAPKNIQDHITTATCLDDVVASAKKVMPPSAVPQSPDSGDEEEGDDMSESEEQEGKGERATPTETELNLAAATLAALLSQYGKMPKSNKRQAHKSLPVIPVHA